MTLLNWLPIPENVTAIVIPTTANCNPNTAKEIIKKLANIKKRHPHAPAVAKIVLQGPKITPALLTALRNNGLIGSTLKCFHLCPDVKESKLASFIPDMLACCPNLSELRLPANVFYHGDLGLCLNRLQSARSNNPTILRQLDLSEGYFYSSGELMTVSDLANLVTQCPELESLKVARLSGLPLFEFPKKNRFGSNDSSLDIEPDNSFLGVPMQSMPRLKTFYVGEIRHGLLYAKSSSVQQLLAWLFAGMPNLENLHFGNGSYSLTNREEKELKFPAYPLLGNALATLPRSIVRLELDYLLVKETDVVNLNPESYPRLKHLKLDHCGTEQFQVISALHNRWPNLTVGVRKATMYEMTNRRDSLAEGVYGAACLSSILNSGQRLVTPEQARNLPMSRW